MVGKDQFRCINSVVVTFVQVMHRDTTWPASRERMNRLVHMLVNRLHELLENAATELKAIRGLDSWASNEALMSVGREGSKVRAGSVLGLSGS